MGSKSDHLEVEILDHIFGKGVYTPPTHIFVGLYTATPSDASTGSSGGTEVSGGSYARKTTDPANWADAASGAIANGAEIAFVEATASWGEVTHFGLFDAITDGNLLYWGAITTPKTIDSGDTAKFAIGDIDVTED